jgi:hypothetical protein
MSYVIFKHSQFDIRICAIARKQQRGLTIGAEGYSADTKLPLLTEVWIVLLFFAFSQK